MDSSFLFALSGFGGRDELSDDLDWTSLFLVVSLLTLSPSDEFC